MNTEEMKSEHDVPESFNGATRLNRWVLFFSSLIFTFGIWFCFFAYAYGKIETDVGLPFIMSCTSLVAMYATHNQLSRGWQERCKLPGELFAYAAMVITFFLYFCGTYKFMGVVKVPCNLHYYFISVLLIFGGSRVFKMMQDGMKFLEGKSR